MKTLKKLRSNTSPAYQEIREEVLVFRSSLPAEAQRAHRRQCETLLISYGAECLSQVPSDRLEQFKAEVRQTLKKD